uniref:Uncharacterized protein n=1 Tax=Anguilla anguilla TaxID=7936 RepID=A0A0E9RLI0_ANGAN
MNQFTCLNHDWQIELCFLVLNHNAKKYLWRSGVFFWQAIMVTSHAKIVILFRKRISAVYIYPLI